MMKAASTELKQRVHEYALDKGGKIYAPILHPDFSDVQATHGPERMDIIAPFLDHPGGTVLDIGTHWGYVAHRLEDMGYQVTAVESSPQYMYFLTEIRDLCGKRFQIYSGSVFELEAPTYDIVIALNIFHHFLKSKRRFDMFEQFLKRLRCKTMIFQAHRFGEKQMETAHKNMEAEEFAHYIAHTAGLPSVQLIGEYSKRKIFKLTAR